ncbi:MAG: ribonuclease HII, partial [Kiritimatiellae bacterium]|nr:ribonuclease HII [Kiritimatiellia bacterium]
HKGYPTPAHLDALRRLGVSPCHRRSFGPVRDVLNPGLF